MTSNFGLGGYIFHIGTLHMFDIVEFVVNIRLKSGRVTVVAIGKFTSAVL